MKLSACRIYKLLSVLLLITSVALRTDAEKLQGYRGLDNSELSSEIWTLCGREELPEKKAEVVVYGYDYYEDLPDRCDYFVCQNDTVYWTGYSVKRYLGMICNAPYQFYTTNAKISDDTISTMYGCYGDLDVSTEVLETGRLNRNILSRGIAVINPGDTVRNVTLTRHIFTDSEMRNDTVCLNLPNREIYRWYANGMTYPFAIQCDGILYVDKSVVPELYTTKDDYNEIDIENVRRVIDEATISRKADGIIITLPEDIELCAFLIDDSGNIYGLTSGIGKEFKVDTTGLQPARYILSIVGGRDIVRKELIVL